MSSERNSQCHQVKRKPTEACLGCSFCLRSNSVELEKEKFLTNTSYQMLMIYFLTKIHCPFNTNTPYWPLSRGYQSRNSGREEKEFQHRFTFLLACQLSSFSHRGFKKKQLYCLRVCNTVIPTGLLSRRDWKKNANGP